MHAIDMSVYDIPNERKLHAFCDPGQEGAPSSVQSPTKPWTGSPKPLNGAHGKPTSASSQIWQPSTSTEPCTGLSHSALC